MNTNENNGATKNPTAATAAAAILAAANAAINNTVTPVANTPTPTSVANTPTPTPAPTAAPEKNTAAPTIPMATPTANAATPAAAPTTPVENTDPMTNEIDNVNQLLAYLTDNTYDEELINDIIDISKSYNTKHKDLSEEGICSMEYAAALFGDKQLKDFRDEAKGKRCKELHNLYMDAISRNNIYNKSLYEIEFLNLMRNRGVYEGDAAWYLNNSKAEAGVEINQQDMFDYTIIAYKLLSLFKDDETKVVSLLGTLGRIALHCGDATRIVHIINSIMISHNMRDSQIISTVFGDAGIMDSATKNKIGKMYIKPGTIMLLDKINIKPLTPIYRIVNPESNPNLAPMVKPDHYYFTIGDTDIVLDIDPNAEIINRIMFNVASKSKAA